MNKIRWGVLSTANIGLEKVIPAMQQGEYCEMAAIASQSLEKGQAAAAQLDIPKACGSYDELLDLGADHTLYMSCASGPGGDRKSVV